MADKKRKNPEDRTPKLDISAPRSMRRAGTGTALLLTGFLGALIYLGYTLVTESPVYMARSGAATYGRVLDCEGDVLFDGTKPLTEYPAGHFADVGNLIGDTSGQMSNTVVARNMTDLANYSFLYGSGMGTATLKTTLSHRANRAVYDAFGSKKGTVIAYNWKTGAVPVCVSRPCVDIAKGYENIAEMEAGSLLCKAFLPTVPGSTQKVSTLIAAYELLGIDKVNTTQYACSGSWLNANGQRINCHNAGGHGTQTLYEAFANSCNPYFAQLVQSEPMQLSSIIETYTHMGYGVNGEHADTMELSGIRIPAASTELTDKTDFDTQWGCLGQGKTLVSPFQLMLWQGAIANESGSAVLPYLIAEKKSVMGEPEALASKGSTAQMFTAEAAKGVHDIMVQNAAEHYYVSLGNYTCGVKSGTAQITDGEREYENSLLAGFCTDENCPIAFCILIEERTSNDVTTAQIAKVLLDALSG